MRLLRDGASVLIFAVGLHVPRSYLFLYLFAGLILLHSLCASHWRDPSVALKGSHRLLLWPTVFFAVFSIAYAWGMVSWQFWQWPVDAADLINALLLPALLYGSGIQAATPRLGWATRVLLAYGLGGLVYGLAALAVAREPWWDLQQVFPLSIQVAWGNLLPMNVRSVEQTAFPALLLLVPAWLLLVQGQGPIQRRLGWLFMGFSLLGAHVVWSLNGRLGWLTLFLALGPVLWQLYGQSFLGGLRRWRRWLPFAAGMAVLVGVLRPFRSELFGKDVGWEQGLCDERISLFGSMLRRLSQAPWGGRLLRVPYVLCGQDSAEAWLAVAGGTVTMAHNVIFDIYFSVGWLATALLLIALAIPCGQVGVGLFWAGSRWSWHVVWRWSWVVLLVCQWSFQPLLYSDGLLYYFSFFVLGLFAAEARAGYWSAGDLGQSASPEALEAST